ncbi:MAG: MMPL family transporter [Bacteroidota bacterium]|nr:MMPL family transporter [Bacteroidota bacterium]
MAYEAFTVKLSYELAQMLPQTDSTLITYKEFKKTFGSDGDVMFIGIQSDNLYELSTFNKWHDLTYDVLNISGIKEVLSTARMYQLQKNDSVKKFDFNLISKKKPKTQKELDSLKSIIFAQPLFDHMLFNKEKNSSLMMITLDKSVLNNIGRVALIEEIEQKVSLFEQKNNIELHSSGLPYIRTVLSKKIKNELGIFVLLAMLISSIALYLFFRSFKAVIFPMLIVLISVIWIMGTMSLLGYKITILTGILPPLLIIIGVENCIFLLNKYHQEFKAHGNKVKSLSRIVQKVGNAIFLTNLTTAVGFAAFIVTRNQMLVEFGVVASINIIAVFVLSLFLIPIFFSYLDPPKAKHVKHLENKHTQRIVDIVVFYVIKKRVLIYSVTAFFFVVGIIGILQLKTTGRLVDDISQSDKLYKDMIFLQDQVNGILPFEISIDTKKPKGAMSLSTLRKIDRFQDTLATYPEFSKPLSIAEVAKASKQAFYNGKVKYYTLPNFQEKNFILSYLPKSDSKNNNKTILNSFIDSTLQETRISVQMANIGTNEIKRIKEDLRPKADKIFPPEKYDVSFTGTTVVYLKGTAYMVKNLIQSLLIALIIISGLMAILFTSGKMVAVSLLPNILPQILTAALMGYLAISIKPSTILIFSIALGISVDNAIHFLSRYRAELKHNSWNIKLSVINALRETAFSMVYSSIILFFGFAIFSLSSFGGTQAMGYLVSFTLLIAVLSNIFVLPSLILSLDKSITTKAFKRPMFELLEEKEDENPEVKNKKTEVEKIEVES